MVNSSDENEDTKSIGQVSHSSSTDEFVEANSLMAVPDKHSNKDGDNEIADLQVDNDTLSTERKETDGSIISNDSAAESSLVEGGVEKDNDMSKTSNVDSSPSIRNEDEIDPNYESNTSNLKYDESQNTNDENLNSAIPDVPDLPARDTIRVCLELDSSDLLLKSNQEEIDKLQYIVSTYDENSPNYLLQSKYMNISKAFDLKDTKLKESIRSGTENIKKTFNDIKDAVGNYSDHMDYKIDWEFWTKIVNNYEDVVQNESPKLNELIMKGIPKEFRGILWQIVSRSKNLQLEEFYYQLKNEPSIHEKSIKRDLTRTSFFTNIDQANKANELFNVIKAYSLFDPDVGYTQGMIFIAVPLIMNMNEAECFCLLVNLMKEYNLRDLFCPDMQGLHKLLYEFDGLLEKYAPFLYNHLINQGIKSSMYASQWFLTFFAYKFPLDIVLRIYDILFTQGIESILKFAVNLLLKNSETLLSLKFDKLVSFLKDNLFNIYVNEDYVTTNDENKKVGRRLSQFGAIKKSPLSAQGYYNLDKLVEDSMEINLEPNDLAKLEYEFEQLLLNDEKKTKEIEKIRDENGKLRYEIKQLETKLATLNNDHVDVVQKLVNLKVTIPELQNDNAEIKDEIDQLNEEIEELQSKINDVSSNEASSSSNLLQASSGIPINIENDIQELLAVNAQEAEKSANLEDELQKLVLENESISSQLKSFKGKTWFGRWK